MPVAHLYPEIRVSAVISTRKGRVSDLILNIRSWPNFMVKEHDRIAIRGP